VHHAARRYDVSVYFEANGHGTLLFSDSAVSAIAAARQRAEASGDAGKAASAARLLAAKQLVNQAIGDAISAILLVEAILLLRGWSIERWDAMYEDLPSRQAKLGVADRAALRVNEDETRTLEPAELQREIDVRCRPRRFLPSSPQPRPPPPASLLSSAVATGAATASAAPPHCVCCAGARGRPPERPRIRPPVGDRGRGASVRRGGHAAGGG